QTVPARIAMVGGPVAAHADDVRTAAVAARNRRRSSGVTTTKSDHQLRRARVARALKDGRHRPVGPTPAGAACGSSRCGEAPAVLLPDSVAFGRTALRQGRRPAGGRRPRPTSPPPESTPAIG